MLRKKWITINVLASALVLILFGSVSAAMEKGPYLIYDGINTEMTVLWQLDSTQFCTIDWGENISYLNNKADTGENGSGAYEHQHTYTIRGLTPGTKYFYQVTCDPDSVGSGSFYTAPLDDADSVKFMVYGDTRSNPGDHDAVNAKMINTYTMDQEYQTITLHVGDWVNNGENEDDWTSQFFDPTYSHIHDFQTNMPINGCRGNHEGNGNLFFKYFPYLYEPGGFYWSFDYGPAHIAVIDEYTNYSPGSTQYSWLENDLASSTKKWKFLVLHEPGWSAGGHSNNADVQNYIQPLAVANGVDIIFAGHNHYYARAVVDGVQHITTGGGGAPLYAPYTNYPNVVKAVKSLDFCEVEIQGDDLYFTSRDENGSILDSFHMNDVGPNPNAFANSDIPVKGTVSGSYIDTHSSDDVFEVITERESGGKPANRYSLLEHKWTINVSGGDIVTFYVEAFKTSNSESDNFVFAYSTNDSAYSEMVTVTKTSDDDAAQSYRLPSSTKGKVYIRVKDTNRTPSNKNLDSIYIDNMYIKSEDAGVPDYDPPSPDPMTWKIEPYPTGDTSIAMEATTADDLIGVEYYFECTIGGGHNSGWQNSPTYEDTGLQPATPYTYRVKARDQSSNQNETAFSITASATIEPFCTAKTLHVNSILAETVRGSKGKKYGKVTVAIYDNCSNPVADADVTGTFNGDFSGSQSATTDANGMAAITTSDQVKKPSYTFCVNSVTKDPLTYDDVEVCDSN